MLAGRCDDSRRSRTTNTDRGHGGTLVMSAKTDLWPPIPGLPARAADVGWLATVVCGWERSSLEVSGGRTTHKGNPWLKAAMTAEAATQTME